MVRKSLQNSLLCFSPPVMLATFLIEIVLAVYVVWRYKMTRLVRLVTALLVLLATFQLAEYMVCGGQGLAGADWSRIGFIAITALPPLGLHIVYELAGKQNKLLLLIAYTSAAAFAAYFAFASTAFVGNQCPGNYVIFDLQQPVNWFYGIYYYFWLLLSLGMSWYLAWHTPKLNRRRALYAFMLSYLVFLLPTATIIAIHPEARAGIPSIMCGFAIILAFIITLRVLPSVANKK